MNLTCESFEFSIHKHDLNPSKFLPYDLHYIITIVLNNFILLLKTAENRRFCVKRPKRSCVYLY